METPSDDEHEDGHMDDVANNRFPASEGSQWAGLPLDGTATEVLLKSFAGELGYKYYLLANMPFERDASFEDCTRLTNWPLETSSAYSKSEMFFGSGVVSHFRRSVLPLSGGSQMFGTEKDPMGRARAGKLLGSHGIQATFAFTLHNSDRQQYLFAFSRRGPSPETIGGDDTLSRGMKILDTLRGTKTPMAEAASQLSQRERECLEWCAMGKTADETAIIMKLSAHTVESYIRTAMKKLGAVNRMQAVARAIRLNAI